MHENEKPTDNEIFNEKTSSADFHPQGIHEVIDSVSVIHILSKILLHWLKKRRTRPELAETLEDLNAILEHSRAIKHRMRGALSEALGSRAALEAKERHNILWIRIKGTLKCMRFFE